jgi:DNA-binding NtrC family response regulator
VRALRHALERAIILSDGETLRLGDFPLPAAGVAAAGVPAATAPRADSRSDVVRASVERDEGSSAQGTLADLERQAIVAALARHDGNVTHAAADLGITRTSLYRRMEKYGLQ